MRIERLNFKGACSRSKMVCLPIHWLSFKSVVTITLAGCVSFILFSCAAPICPSSVKENRQIFGVSQARSCRIYSPASGPAEKYLFLARSVTQTEKGVTVTAAVLSDKEAEEFFSLNLANYDIQPVWLEIANNTDQRVRFLPVALDPGYFFPNEVASMYHTGYDSLNEMITENLNCRSIDRVVPAGARKSGFIYTRRDPGIKYLNVMLYGPERREIFVYYFQIPGIKLDYQRVDFASIYPEAEMKDLEDEDELRAALEAIPCCTTKKDGSGENDPLNFFIIGDPDDIFSAFIRRGWDVTEPIYLRSALRDFKAFFSHIRYRTSPMSSLYFYKRAQDVGLQKVRDTIHERNHLRVWMTPLRYRGKSVWIGTISRDIGTYLTIKTPWLTAHAIDPDLDEARSYLVQDLVFSRGVRKFGYVKGAEPSTREKPRWNLMEQPWWSDGRRAVFIFGSEPTTLDEVELLPWVWREEYTEPFNESLRREKHGSKN